MSVSAGLTRAQREKDPTIQRAVVRSIELIGEASKRVPAEMREANPQVQWRSMARMRDRLVHGPSPWHSGHRGGHTAGATMRRATPHPSSA